MRLRSRMDRLEDKAAPWVPAPMAVLRTIVRADCGRPHADQGRLVAIKALDSESHWEVRRESAEQEEAFTARACALALELSAGGKAPRLIEVRHYDKEAQQ